MTTAACFQNATSQPGDLSLSVKLSKAVGKERREDRNTIVQTKILCIGG